MLKSNKLQVFDPIAGSKLLNNIFGATINLKMKNTKEKILLVALDLLNSKGLPNVTMRQIAYGLQISQGNLTYHFSRKEEIIEALYFQLLLEAQKDRAALTTAPLTLEAVYEGLKSGMETLYNYRFLMVDINQAMRENRKLHAHYLSLQKFRDQANKTLFAQLTAQGIFRAAELPEEYETLTRRMRLCSDYWLASCELYGMHEVVKTVDNYALFLLEMFYPYLTAAGKAEYRKLFPDVRGFI
jgi:AcrR family transcriptional regulator